MKFLLNLLFPKFCIGCNAIGSYICDRCFSKLEFLNKQQCSYCLLPSTNGAVHKACLTNMGLHGSVSLLSYSGLTKVFIKDIKYRRIYSVLDDFFEKLPPNIYERCVESLISFKIEYIQPIPLHPMRQRLRGFNQSAHIANHISNMIDKPIINVLSRIRNTSAQAQIPSRADRLQNIKGAFEYSGGPFANNSTILLVDDLFTSGSTVKEAARELIAHGVNKVYSCTLAHG